AEIALDEGELLALRLPEAAEPLLTSALAWFERCDDPVGALLAAGALALLQARPGYDDGLAATLRRGEAAYRATREGGAGLPTWERLERLAQAPDPAALDALPTRWRPWLLRLLVALVLRDRDPTRAARVAALQRSVDRYRAAAGGRSALPADLAPLLDAEEPV